MKTILYTLSLILFCFTANAQSFEGAVTYTNTYKSKVPNVADEQFATMMGSVLHYYIKGGEYRSELNGTLLQWQVYVNKDNKLYTKMANSPNALSNDGGTNNDEVVSSVINKGVATILGYKCDELIITTKGGVQKYYYSSQLPMDGKLYANHKYGNWDLYAQKSQAVPLKITMDTPQFSMESIATEVKAAKLNDSLFALPAGINVVKNPY